MFRDILSRLFRSGHDFETLSEGLAARDSQLRLKAVFALEQLKDQRAVGLLTQALGSEFNQDVKHAIIKALGRFRDVAAVPALSKLLGPGNDEDSRTIATRSLAEIGGETVIAPLTRQLCEGPERVRQAALDALELVDRNWLNSEASFRVFSSLLWNSRLDPSKEAASWLARGNLSWAQSPDNLNRVTSRLRTLLSRDDDALRRECTTLLEKLHDHDVVEAMIAETGSPGATESDPAEAMRQVYAILTDPDTSRHGEALPLLGQLGHRELSTLVAELQKSSPEAAAGLGRISEPSAIPGFVEAIEAEDYQTRMGGINALGALSDIRAFDDLRALLEHANADVRCAALRSLGTLGEERALALILDALGDDDTFVRRTAARVLGARKEAVAVGRLTQLVESEESADTLRTIIWALGEIGDPAAIEPIARAALHFSEHESGALMDARNVLSDLGNSKALPVLKDALGAYKPAVRLNALFLLQIIGDQSVVSPVVRLLDDPRREIREAAASTLEYLQKSSADARRMVDEYRRKKEARLQQRSCPKCQQSLRVLKITDYVEGCLCSICDWSGVWCYECRESPMQATPEVMPGLSVQAWLECQSCGKRGRADEQIIAWLTDHRLL